MWVACGGGPASLPFFSTTQVRVPLDCDLEAALNCVATVFSAPATACLHFYRDCDRRSDEELAACLAVLPDGRWPTVEAVDYSHRGLPAAVAQQVVRLCPRLRDRDRQRRRRRRCAGACP